MDAAPGTTAPRPSGTEPVVTHPASADGTAPDTGAPAPQPGGSGHEPPDGPPPAPPARLPSPDHGIDWARIVGGVGRVLVAAGAILLLFVAYQLWGTAIHERRAQGDLRAELESTIGAEVYQQVDGDLPESLDPGDVVAADRDPSSTPSGIAAGQLGSTDVLTRELAARYGAFVLDGPPPAPEAGGAVARIRIPAINVDKVVVHGVETDGLKDGPGHYPDTPLPGQPGNAAIAGHRTTYGAPFENLDDLEENDLVYATTAQGAFVYRVAETLIVRPDDTWVLDPTDDSRLTLTTCHPRYSARERMVVIAELVGDAAAAAPPPAGAATPTTEVGPDVDPPTVAVAVPAAADDGLDAGLDGERASTAPSVLAGLIVAVVWMLIWVVGRLWRRWAVYLAGLPLLLVALYVFFEQISTVLPANV